MASPTHEIYIAFLRGINVGGHKKVPMANLAKIFSKLGYANVKTYLASGNVSFTAEKIPTEDLRHTIEQAIEHAFGFPVDVIIRTIGQLQKIKRADPFAGVKVTKDTRLYVTFLGKKTKPEIAIPYKSPDGSFHILAVVGTEVFSVLDVSKAKTPEAMNILEKQFTKNITTRNWNTIEKIIDSLG